MIHSKDSLLAEALKLTEAERADLAAKLLDCLDDAAVADTDAAGNAEIERRLDDLRLGHVKSVPWEDAKRMIAQYGDAREAG